MGLRLRRLRGALQAAYPALGAFPERHLHPALLCALGQTGLRPGEMLALRWGNLDLEGDHGSLRVRRTLDKYSAAVFGAAKTRPQASLLAF
jgi:integrase